MRKILLLFVLLGASISSHLTQAAESNEEKYIVNVTRIKVSSSPQFKQREFTATTSSVLQFQDLSGEEVKKLDDLIEKFANDLKVTRAVPDPVGAVTLAPCADPVGAGLASAVTPAPGADPVGAGSASAVTPAPGADPVGADVASAVTSARALVLSCQGWNHFLGCTCGFGGLTYQ